MNRKYKIRFILWVLFYTFYFLVFRIMNEILFFLLGYIPTSLGLYFLAKHAEKWISIFAFIPILQFSLISTLAGYWWNMVLFFIAISVIAVFFPFLYIFVVLFFIFLLFQMWMRTHWKVWLALFWAVFPPIWIPVSWFYYQNKMSKKENQIQQQKKAILEEKRRSTSDTLSIKCNECNKSLKVKKELAEKVKKWKCPNCGNIIQLI